MVYTILAAAVVAVTAFCLAALVVASWRFLDELTRRRDDRRAERMTAEDRERFVKYWNF